MHHPLSICHFSSLHFCSPTSSGPLQPIYVWLPGHLAVTYGQQEAPEETQKVLRGEVSLTFFLSLVFWLIQKEEVPSSLVAPVAATEGLGGFGSCGVSDSNSNNSNPHPHPPASRKCRPQFCEQLLVPRDIAAPHHLWAVLPSPFVPSALLRQRQTVP